MDIDETELFDTIITRLEYLYSEGFLHATWKNESDKGDFTKALLRMKTPEEIASELTETK